MPEYPVQVGAVCAYKMALTSPIVVDRDMVSVVASLFPSCDVLGWASGQDLPLRHVDPRFDGVMPVPTIGADGYHSWLATLINECGCYLQSHGWIFATHASPLLGSAALRPSERACLPPMCEEVHTDVVAMQFQLGALHAGKTPLYAQHFLVGDEGVLDIGLGLLGLTILDSMGILKQVPVRVDCPGTLFSVGADGKWGDGMRWDVQPPSKYSPGVIELDWNWFTNRARITHGTATGRILL